MGDGGLPGGSSGPRTNLCPGGEPLPYVLAEAEIYMMEVPEPVPFPDPPVGETDDIREDLVS